MSDKMKTTGTDAAPPRLVLERTYRARPEELWELWTTKEGFESWWGPDGFRVEVHALEARVGGALHYDMIADSPEMIEAMKQMGQPTRNQTRGRFSELTPQKRLAIIHVIDFFPGVKPYDNTMIMELFPSGDHVRMVVTLEPMHDGEFTRMQSEGMASQLGKLDRRFA